MAYDMYQEIILQHYRSPRNFGRLEVADREGEESNPLCGDHLLVQLKLDPAGARIDEVKFSGDGCAISVATASLLTSKVKGLTLDEASHLTREDVLGLVGIPLSPVRVKCALTSFAALGRALHPSAAASGTPVAPVASGGGSDP
ncbi:MAG: iron-sulfur cluster assembly scaffold protein [Thermoplasmata archaeon]